MENNNTDTNTEPTNQSIQNDGFSPESVLTTEIAPTIKKEMNELTKRKIGALWLRVSKGGNKYLSGEIEIRGHGKIKISVLKNNMKDKEKLPDYQIFLQTTETAKDILD